ncbi:transcriptional regulator [Rhodococcus sp. H29-C3]|uniref:transcriptional regulator n=1 Tax=Rhodococcus sp. H29-C3 TaxID=3046307 RepID=UPI0024BB3EBF|nr:transcriptional regulator [Rhodococcus sp. H29-C3]MDJ0360634.1 transcriptional regulator [Rhodococcus sp. H29-C3]
MSKTHTQRRPALIALVIVSALGCLALGWWQWERFEAVGGDGQNLGYAFQWPLFAAFVVYAYRKFVQLEDEADAPEDAENDGVAEQVVREVPADLLPQRPVAPVEDDLEDPEARQLLEYNSYLAELDRSRESDRSTK